MTIELRDGNIGREGCFRDANLVYSADTVSDLRFNERLVSLFTLLKEREYGECLLLYDGCDGRDDEGVREVRFTIKKHLECKCGYLIDLRELGRAEEEY